MHLFRWYKPSVLLAQLTHRVLLYIGVPNPLPHTPITTAGLRISVVLLVPLCLLLGVFLTKPSVGKPWTAGVGTGSLRFAWHCFPPSAVVAGVCSAGYTKSAPYRRPYDSPHTSPPCFAFCFSLKKGQDRLPKSLEVNSTQKPLEFRLQFSLSQGG